MDLEIMNKATMSSLEIAELTGKRHADVMRDIEKILNEANIGVSKFASTYLDKSNRESKCYNLPRMECDLVISGYSVKYRMAIIKRWHELEGQNSLPQSLPEALRLYADQVEQNEQLKLQAANDAPKVTFADNVIASGETMNIGKYAKNLSQETGIKVGGNKLFAYLREAGYLMVGRDELERNLPYQKYVNNGYFAVKHEHKQIKYQMVKIPVTQITGKGQFELAEEILSHFAQLQAA